MKSKYSLLVSLALATAWIAPAHAINGTLDQLIDLVIQAADPSLAPAKPLIVCAIDKGGGNAALTCMEDAAVKQAAQQAGSLVPFDTNDPRIQQIITVVKDINANNWAGAVTAGGPVVVQTVVCALLPLAGPAKGPACGVVGYVIKNDVGVLTDAYTALSNGPDWWGLTKVLSTEVVCMFLPDDGVAGTVKTAVCGVLGTVLAGAKDAVEAGWKLIEGGINGLGDLLSGQSDAMPQAQYYTLYWMPWYHYGTSLCVTNACKGLSALEADDGRIWGPCKNYFDGHKYSSDNAKDICNGFRDRFAKEVKEYAAALGVAADVYVQNMRPWASTWAVEDYGKNATAQHKAFIQQNAESWLRTKFPFPEPDPGRCGSFKQSPAYANPLFKPLLDQLYQQCLSDAATQAPSPTVWSHVATEAAGKFVAIMDQENQALGAKLPKVLLGGCAPPQGWTAAQGLKFECNNYPGYQACLATLSAGAELQHCHFDSAKADAQIVSKLMSALGTKRCQASGTDVLCSRPWKHDKCSMLRAQLAAGGPTKVACKEGPVAAVAAFAVEKTRADKILAALNSGASQKQLVGKPSTPSCNTHFDPLTIFCSDPNWAATLPQKLPGATLPHCGPDPNADGADAPCLGGPWQTLDKDAVQTAKPVASALATGLAIEPAMQVLTRKGGQNVAWGATMQIADADLIGVESGQCRAGLHFDVRNLGPGASRPADIRIDVNGQSAATRAGGTLQPQGIASYDLYMPLRPGTNRVVVFLGGTPARATSGAPPDAPTVILDVQGSCGGAVRALPNAVRPVPAQRTPR